jgi:hypothetical protein
VNYYNDPASMVDATVAEIRSLEADVLAIEADIRSSTQVTAVFERVVGTFGRLDLWSTMPECRPGSRFSRSPRKNGTWSSTRI